MTVFDIISTLQKTPCISGYEEYSPKEHYKSLLSQGPQWIEDESGNLFCVVKGKEPNKTILLEAHRDVIGLCIKEHLENSFYSLSSCGGIDASVLLSLPLTVHCRGGVTLPAVSASKPPHVLSDEDKKKKPSVSDLYLDTGVFDDRVKAGDSVSFRLDTAKLEQGKIVSCGLDNAVSVAALFLCAEKIKDPEYNVIFLLSVSEETNSRGISRFLSDHPTDCAIVLDAGFHHTRGLDETKCILMGKGPAVSVTDTLSLSLTHWIQALADRKGIPLQVVCEPGGTGTSATSLQLKNGGTPSAVLSIPIANMHTPSEIVMEQDIVQTVDLLMALCSEKELPCQEVLIYENK